MVYKGRIDGMSHPVAIKMLHRLTEEKITELEAEISVMVNILSRRPHQNIVTFVRGLSADISAPTVCLCF